MELRGHASELREPAEYIKVEDQKEAPEEVGRKLDMHSFSPSLKGVLPSQAHDGKEPRRGASRSPKHDRWQRAAVPQPATLYFDTTPQLNQSFPDGVRHCDESAPQRPWQHAGHRHGRILDAVAGQSSAAKVLYGFAGPAGQKLRSRLESASVDQSGAVSRLPDAGGMRAPMGWRCLGLGRTAGPHLFTRAIIGRLCCSYFVSK